MGINGICFGTYCNCASVYEIEGQAEFKYQHVYKKLASFLYSHPLFSFTLTFYGPWFEWIETHHPEFLTILSELSNRKQIEVLGGGYYNPIFPFLLPVDRVGQIELLTTSIRKTVGRRPRGLYLSNGIWDPSCISGFKSCGMEYVLLNSSVIPDLKGQVTDYQPLVVEEQGKSIIVFPVTEINDTTIERPDSVYSTCSRLVSGKQSFTSSIVYYNLSESIIESLIDEGWLEKISRCFSVEGSSAELMIPSKALKVITSRQKAFIPAGIATDVGQWSKELYKTERTLSDNHNLNSRSTVRDFLLTYPETLSLYSRMMYSSLLLNQCRGDKTRKKAAREKLWESQCGSSYIFTGSDGCSDRASRQNAYTCIIQAERLIREANGFCPSIIGYDLDADSIKEYVCQYPIYNAFISQLDGTIFELDLMQSAWNYSDACERVLFCDRMADSNRKKLFNDFLFDLQEFSCYSQSLCADKSIFAKAGYTEQSFDRSKKEIILKSNGFFGTYSQNVSLRKKISLSPEGVQIQYIIKNESPMHIKAIFAVESTFSLSGTDLSGKTLETIIDGVHETYTADTEINKETSVSLLQITDSQSQASFILEPNEDAGMCCQPLKTRRPLLGQMNEIFEGVTGVMFWQVELDPGYETEKTLNMQIILTKKSSLRKKR